MIELLGIILFILALFNNVWGAILFGVLALYNILRIIENWNDYGDVPVAMIPTLLVNGIPALICIGVAIWLLV